MKKLLSIILFLTILLFESCSTSEIILEQNQTPQNYKYLALGDSYTIGQSVCGTCRFPIQLQDSIKKKMNVSDTFTTKIIAQTGWTTTNLKTRIDIEKPSNNYDIVTLLIGVNNQYQNKPFSLYEQEFPELVNQAIGFAKGNKDNLIVVSIPDYAFTPYGNGSINISIGIDLYNAFAENYCITNNISFINITDITQLGLIQTNLVASDGLHSSELAYSKFVERILPLVKIKLGL